MGKIIINKINYSGSAEYAEKITYNNSISGLSSTDTQAAIDELAQLFYDGLDIVNTSLVNMGIESAENANLSDIAIIMKSLNKGEFNRTLTSLDGVITLPAGYYTGGTININLSGQTYTAIMGSGTKTTCAENRSVTVPFGAITEQTANLLNVSGGLITALADIPASSLSFTIKNNRSNSGNGNSATATVATYKGSTKISTNTVSIPGYGRAGTNTIEVNVPAMSEGDTIKVVGTHASGYIDGTLNFTITSATHSWIM